MWRMEEIMGDQVLLNHVKFHIVVIAIMFCFEKITEKLIVPIIILFKV